MSFMSLPHGLVSQSATLTATGGTTADLVTFDTDELKEWITHSTSTNPSRITIQRSGSYLVSFSAIFKSTTANKRVNLWLSVNGTPVARSNTIMVLPNNIETLMTVTLIYEFACNDYFELNWWSDDAGCQMLATAAQATPTRPACPAIILTVNKVGE